MAVDTVGPARQGALYEVDVRRNVRVPSADAGLTIATDIWLPVTDELVPAVVMLLPYRKDLKAGASFEPAFRYLAERGFACLLADIRGTGSSDGPTEAMLDGRQADDGVSLVEWAAEQPWCTGSVGMWGQCAGGLSTMYTAARRPPALKAIIAVTNPSDVGVDAMTHDGIRSDVQSTVRRAGANLLLHLLPPTAEFASVEGQRRWRQRLSEFDPALMAGCSYPADDPVWRAWRIDPSSFTAATMCVGGWRDLYTNATIRAFEQVTAPKKLVVGPWMHSMPHKSPYDPVDFLPIVLRWWDHWLRGADNGVMDEPPISVFVQGKDSGWRSYESWPPADGAVTLATAGDTELAPAVPGAEQTGAGVIAEYRPDPTIGALAGLCLYNGEGGLGVPVDQHDDDMRSALFASAPLADDVVIAGQPEVTVRLAGDGAEPPEVQRIVVRLTAVDPDGRSTLIVGGVARPEEPTYVQPVTLRRTVFRVSAGHRLRVAICDSDFPLLRPLAHPVPLRIVGVELRVPTVSEKIGVDLDMPRLEAATPALPGSGVEWSISRDPINDGVEVTFGFRSEGRTSGEGHRFETRSLTRSTVRRAAPQAAVISGDYGATLDLNSGEHVAVQAEVRCTEAAFWARGEVVIDGAMIFSGTWDAPLVPEFDP
jgi:putative CocE/NonD family hydrolase